jgi:transcriptional regulator with XRE-family HTH domain
MSAVALTGRMPPPKRRVGIERTVTQRHRELVRGTGRDLRRIRLDAGATQRQVAALAGIDHSHYARIEAGLANASVATLVAISVALGSDLAVRLYPGTGPRLTDRHQARMVEALLRSLDHDWRPHVEVVVSTPARGIIDVVLERRPHGLLVATEAYSAIARLEQQIRWSADKANSLRSSELVSTGEEPSISRLLVLRSTEGTRALARQFEATLRAAYPARCSDVIAALRSGTTWPGAGLVWMRIEGDVVELLDGPPRGVALGR